MNQRNQKMLLKKLSYVSGTIASYSSAVTWPLIPFFVLKIALVKIPAEDNELIQSNYTIFKYYQNWFHAQLVAAWKDRWIVGTNVLAIQIPDLFQKQDNEAQKQHNSRICSAPNVVWYLKKPWLYVGESEIREALDTDSLETRWPSRRREAQSWSSHST